MGEEPRSTYSDGIGQLCTSWTASVGSPRTKRTRAPKYLVTAPPGAIEQELRDCPGRRQEEAAEGTQRGMNREPGCPSPSRFRKFVKGMFLQRNAFRPPSGQRAAFTFPPVKKKKREKKVLFQEVSEVNVQTAPTSRETSVFSFLLPSPRPGVFSSLGDSGVSSPKGGSRLLSGWQCQSLDFQTMLLCPAGPVPGAARTPLGFPASPERRASGLRSRPLRSFSTFSPPRPADAAVPRPRLYPNTGSRQTNSCESNSPTRVQLTNFQQIAPRRVRPLGCPLLYIPSRPAALRVWTRRKQCASLSLGYCSALSVEEGRKKK